MPSNPPTIKEAAMAHLAKPEVIQASENIQKIFAETPAGHCLSPEKVAAVASAYRVIYNSDVVAYHDQRKQAAAQIMGVVG